MPFIKKYFWFFFAALTLLLRAFFQAFPNWTEHLYSRGIFQGVRYAMDYLLGWLPFPLVYVLFGVLFLKLVTGIRYLFFQKTTPIRQRLLTSGRHLLAFLCGVIVLFHWLWGYNYSRISIEQHLVPAGNYTHGSGSQNGFGCSNEPRTGFENTDPGR